MGVPNLEKAPGIPEPWVGLWRAALVQLREQGTWVPAQRALLDEYANALMVAARARDEGEFGAEDKASKRALAYAEALGLTAKARKMVVRVGKESPEGDSEGALAKLYEFKSA